MKKDIPTVVLVVLVLVSANIHVVIPKKYKFTRS